MWRHLIWRDSPNIGRFAGRRSSPTVLVTGTASLVVIPWAEAAACATSGPDFVLWRHRPDDRVDSGNANLETLAKEAAQQLSSKDFWYLVRRLTTGRRLVITSDHRYAGTGHFPLTEDEDQAKYLQQNFKSGRLASNGSTLRYGSPGRRGGAQGALAAFASNAGSSGAGREPAPSARGSAPLASREASVPFASLARRGGGAGSVRNDRARIVPVVAGIAG